MLKIKRLCKWGGVLVLLFISVYYVCQSPKKVHLSFDDVALDSSSDFEDFVEDLKIYNSLYGAKFSLYTFDVPENIVCNDKLSKTSGWLKFSYHGSSQPFDTVAARTHYLKTLSHQLDLLRKMAGDSCLTKTVRLHYYYGDSAMLKEASLNGLTAFLSADAPGRLSYHLDSCKSASLYNSGTLIDDSKKFYRTDVRLEQTTLWNCIANDNLSDTTLVIFTHKNKFGRYAKIKLHALMLFLWLNNYEFVIDL